jgi:hypothetical protein
MKPAVSGDLSDPVTLYLGSSLIYVDNLDPGNQVDGG